MGKTYEKMDIGGTVQDVMEKWHGELADAGVTVDVLMVSTDSDTPPLKLRGCPCAAICRIQPLKARALGCADAEIQIDKVRWDHGSEAQRRALLDHELNHLDLACDKKTGEVKRDDLDRPKLLMRLHDYELGWFTVCAARNGADSMERRQAQALMDSAGETYWPSKTATA